MTNKNHYSKLQIIFKKWFKQYIRGTYKWTQEKECLTIGTLYLGSRRRLCRCVRRSDEGN